MRRLSLLILLPLLALSGCDTSYPNEEMDVAGSAKTRPFAVVVEPAEASPGDAVRVTLHYYEPEPSRHDVAWRVARDYDIGLYEADEVERDVVAIESVDPPTWDAHGFCSQSFEYVVPADVFARSSAHPDVLVDPMIVEPARLLLALAPGAPVAKAALDAKLADLGPYGPGWFDAHTPEQVAAALWLGDVYATRIRFRAAVDGTVPVEVVRNVTIRHARRFETVNVNLNPERPHLELFWIMHPEVPHEDVHIYPEEERGRVLLATPDSTAVGVEVPVDPAWTYYLAASFELQDYTSPFGELVQHEDYRMSWYHADLDVPGRGHGFFVTDDGDEAEMRDITHRIVRVVPPPGGATTRVTAVVRDFRIEWEGYGYSPGASVLSADVTFTAP